MWARSRWSWSLLKAATDALGLGLAFAVGDPGPLAGDPAAIPIPLGLFEQSTDVAINLHDGLLLGVLESDALDGLNQNIELPGFLGVFMEPLLGGLPGGR